MKPPITRWTRFFIAAVLPAACAQAVPPEPTEQSEPTTANETKESSSDRYAGAPKSARSIAQLLMARHKQDLPGKETLAHYDDAEASLAWLADHGGRMVLRVRALASLRFYTGDTTRQVLLHVLTSPDSHAALRAAAITGSGGLDLDRDAELRAAVEQAARQDDPRIARAVERRMQRNTP
ncbi:MAG TPA: hypothetical protein VFB62_11220 [Polyangiaceae bacterium]|nr:hypothetical protein [Polyangiaceae bacterium]